MEMRSLLLPPGYFRNVERHVSVTLDVTVVVFLPLVLVLNGMTMEEDWTEIGAKRKRDGGKNLKLTNYAPISFAVPPRLGSLPTQFFAKMKLATAIFSGLALAIVAP